MWTKRCPVIAALTVCVLFSVPLCAQVSISGPIRVEEYLGRETVESPVLTPDGRMVAFSVGTKAEWDGRRTHDIWLVPTAGGERLQLTNSAVSDWGPQWSPDGASIAFLSERSGQPQVFVISITGGEARQITHAMRGIDGFRWIDEVSLAYTTREPRNPELEKAEAEAGGGYEYGTTGTTSSLWRIRVDDSTAVERVSDGSYFIDAFAVAPGGDHFALITATDSDLYSLITDGELRLIDRDGTTVRVERPGRNLTDPEFSPDGRRFSVVASTVGLSAADGLFVFTVGVPGGRNLTIDFDPAILGTRWVDSSTVSFTSLRGTTCGIYSASVGRGGVRTLLEPEMVMLSHAGPGPEGELVFVASRGTEPDRLMAVQAGASPGTAITLYDPNPWLRNRPLVQTEVIRYRSFDGTMIEAVVTLPGDPYPRDHAPMLLLPHGGPDGMSLDDFSFLPQFFAQRGILVFEPNFRGGIGFGREFYAANRGRIGDVDYRDMMAGVDYLVESGTVDPARLVVGGSSFGGTMSNWIVGHTGRFRAAVSVAGASNYVSRYGTGDVNYGEAARWEFGRLLTEDIDFFLDSSPIRHLEGCSTPTLLMHGELDRRVPVGQAYEMYRALREHGVETRLVLYPNAGHMIADPHQFRDLLTRWFGWYESHLSMGDPS